MNNDGKIDDQHDMKAMGNPKTPELQFGIPLGISYKGWDLSMLFQGAALTSLQLSGPAVWDFPVMVLKAITWVSKEYALRFMDT